MSAESQPPDFRRRGVAGTAEGLLALLCMAYVFSATVTPADRFDVPWNIIVVVAFGIGLGIGGWRFGSGSARAAGALAALVLGIAVVVLVAIWDVCDWAYVLWYWSHRW